MSEWVCALSESRHLTTLTIESGPRRRSEDRGLAAERRPSQPRTLDPSTLQAAYGEHRDAAYQLAYRILGDGAAAQDAVQDAFIKLWTSSAQFDPARGSMRGLLLTIARFTSIDVIRRRARRQQTESAYCTGETWTSDGPESATERREDARSLKKALLALPTEQRSVIEMAYFSGLTHRQIADAMTTSMGTVKSRLRLAMRKLALSLGDRAMLSGFDSSGSGRAENTRAATARVNG